MAVRAFTVVAHRRVELLSDGHDVLGDLGDGLGLLLVLTLDVFELLLKEISLAFEQGDFLRKQIASLFRFRELVGDIGELAFPRIFERLVVGEFFLARRLADAGDDEANALSTATLRDSSLTDGRLRLPRPTSRRGPSGLRGPSRPCPGSPTRPSRRLAGWPRLRRDA